MKHALDSGAAATLDEAERLLQGFTLWIEIGDNSALEAHQTSLLTAVALARRVFLGGVMVVGPLDVPLRCPIVPSPTLRAAVLALGGTIAAAVPGLSRRLSIGGEPSVRLSRFHVRTVFAGWAGGVVPADSKGRVGPVVMPLAPMLASALAVAEAYSDATGESVMAGRQELGMSLWQPARLDWLAEDGAPALERMPSRLWLIGLGHLGQAYLWALGLLPYPRNGLELVLQDFDVVTPSTVSTSILTDESMVGMKKTRSVATWAEQRGFATTIIERSFDTSFKRAEAEPSVALCGLDNARGRRALESVGFESIVEAGLGNGHRDFRTMRLHTLPGPTPAPELWRTRSSDAVATLGEPYKRMVAENRLDQCGATLLAGKAVGAPFVGATAACLAIAELLRPLHGGASTSVIDLDMCALEHRSVVGLVAPLKAPAPPYVSRNRAPESDRSEGG